MEEGGDVMKGWMGVEGMRWKWMKMSGNGRELKNPRLGHLFSAKGCLDRGLGALRKLI